MKAPCPTWFYPTRPLRRSPMVRIWFLWVILSSWSPLGLGVFSRTSCSWREWTITVFRRRTEMVVRSLPLLTRSDMATSISPGWNATYANGMLRQLCNPNGKKIAGTNFHVGDRIIIRERMGLEQRGSDGDADPS